MAKRYVNEGGKKILPDPELLNAPLKVGDTFKTDNPMIQIVESFDKKLERNISSKIISGDIIAFGFITPIKRGACPEFIPSYLWDTEKFNRALSSLVLDNIEYENIHVIRNTEAEQIIIDAKPVVKIMDKIVGRPSIKEQIIDAYEQLEKEGLINYSKFFTSHTTLIQTKVRELNPDIKDNKGMEKEAIRRTVGARFQDKKQNL